MKKKRILICVNHEIVIYNFRKELVYALLEKDHDVYISSPEGPKTNILKEHGAHIIPLTIERHSKNPIKDIKLYFEYRRIIMNVKPNIILTYTIKPNIYAGFASRMLNVPYIVTITGLGSALNKGIKSFIPHFLYQFSLKKAHHIFFQNQENYQYMIKHRLFKGSSSIVRGSGVNLNEFKLEPFPKNNHSSFMFVGRIMKAKGINNYLRLAKTIKQDFPETEFHLVGSMEEDYQSSIEDLNKNGTIIYHGSMQDVRPIYQKVQAIILPSYHEGLSNVLLEAASTGRVIIASDISGCKETFVEGESGLSFNPYDFNDMMNKVKKFMRLPLEIKEHMGLKGRAYVEKHFDRREVVQKHIETIEEVL